MLNKHSAHKDDNYNSDVQEYNSSKKIIEYFIIIIYISTQDVKTVLDSLVNENAFSCCFKIIFFHINYWHSSINIHFIIKEIKKSEVTKEIKKITQILIKITTHNIFTLKHQLILIKSCIKVLNELSDIADFIN